jgi:predicted RNase H-like HicB family nuclease
MEFRRYSIRIQREDDGFVSICPELDIASQGGTAKEARRNLEEAIEMFLETAPQEEISRRLQT